MDRITIIGLGYIGSSLGMAIRNAYGNKVEVVGYDGERRVHNQATKIGAADRAEWNLDEAVQGADMIVLAIPAYAIPEVLEAASRHLKDGATVTDTANTKRAIIEVAEEILPSGIGFVGGNPLVGGGQTGQDNASAAIFAGSRWAIVAGPRTPQGSVSEVTNMVESLGAKAFFVDAHEHDSYMAAVNGLPTLVSAALMSTAASSPSWREISRFASAEFNSMTELAEVDPAANYAMCNTNSDMLVHWIDQVTERLNGMKVLIQDDKDREDPDGQLMDTFVHSWEARVRVVAGIEPGSETSLHGQLPTAGEGIMQMFLGGAGARLLGRTGDSKRDPTRYDRSRLR